MLGALPTLSATYIAYVNIFSLMCTVNLSHSFYLSSHIEIETLQKHCNIFILVEIVCEYKDPRWTVMRCGTCPVDWLASQGRGQSVSSTILSTGYKTSEQQIKHWLSYLLVKLNQGFEQPRKFREYQLLQKECGNMGLTAHLYYSSHIFQSRIYSPSKSFIFSISEITAVWNEWGNVQHTIWCFLYMCISLYRWLFQVIASCSSDNTWWGRARKMQNSFL